MNSWKFTGVLMLIGALHLSAQNPGSEKPASPLNSTAPAAAAQRPPGFGQANQEASRADRQKMLDLLKITSLRRGRSGNPQGENPANYDEAKANPFPKLPDPLLFKNGQKVETAAQWEQRRAEIVEDFDREVYGRVPKETPAVKWVVTSTPEEKNGEVSVITKKLEGRVDNAAHPDITVNIQASLSTPATAKGPVPVIMQFGFLGGFGGARGPTANRPPGASQANAGPTWQQQCLAKGWGYAVISPNSVQADNGAGLTQGIIGLCNQGQARQPEAWGALRAWAWGASRALDYFETDPAVDAKRVGLEGHSRYGKATLVALAYDPRFATGYVSSSGASGAKLHRRDYGEIVENVCATSEYHWMAGNYLKYAGPLTWDDLPVDSHQLVAMCAPRPVFISAGDKGDGWVDAKGSFLAGVGASPVYELLGKKGLGASEFPALEREFSTGEVAFRQHAGGHTDRPNWPTFQAFAARYFEPAK